MQKKLRKYLWIASCLTGIVAVDVSSLHAAKAEKAKTKRALNPKSSQSWNLNSEFDIGKNLYAQQKYAGATVVFDKILKKYPAHEPSIQLYAKSLYRLNKIPESYPLYARLNPQYLDVETSYEFGQAFYSVQQFEGALFAFKRVPKAHAIFDLASYYGALSAMKLRRFGEAEDLLDQAVVLPEKLAASRKIYAAHLAQMRLLQERSQLIEEQNAEKKRLAVQKELRSYPEVGTSGEAKKAEALPKLGYWETEKYARLGFQYRQQNTDFSGLKESQASVKIGYFRFATGLEKSLPSSFSQNPHRFGLLLNFEVNDQQTVGSERRLYFEEDTPTIIRSLNLSTKAHTQNGLYLLSPWTEIVVSPDTWLGFFAAAQQRFPEFAREGLGSSLKAGSTFYLLRGIHRSLSQVQHEQLFNQRSKSLYGKSSIQSLWDIGFSTQTHIIPSLQYDHFSYEDAGVEGPDQTAKAAFESYQILPLGVRLGAIGSFSYQHNYLVYPVVDFSEISANGQSFGGDLYLKCEISWFKFSVISSLQKTDWQVPEKAAQELFLALVPDSTWQTVAELSVNLLF